MKDLITKESQKKYGENFKNHLLEQYKIYLISVENVSNRRQKSNEFFLTLNTAILALIGYILANDYLNIYANIFFIASITGGVICYCWFKIIKSYKKLNEKKFEIIYKLEEYLPINLFFKEWSLLKEGKDKKTYSPFTSIEFLIPIFFGCVYLLIFLNFIPWLKSVSVISYTL